jgi:hypothetical protein
LLRKLAKFLEFLIFLCKIFLTLFFSQIGLAFHAPIHGWYPRAWEEGSSIELINDLFDPISEQKPLDYSTLYLTRKD